MDAMVARTRKINGVYTSLADLGYSDVGLVSPSDNINFFAGRLTLHPLRNTAQVR